MTRARGFTLIEVLVTVFVMGVGLLALAGLQIIAKKASFDAAQRTLAAMLGVQRPSLNKILKDFERDGLITTGYAAIDITGVFCTAATAMSRVYEIEIDKRREDIAVFSEPCPGLAGLIELGAPPEELKVVIDDHVDALRRRIGRHPDKAILGCTHYPLVQAAFQKALGPGVKVYSQPQLVAESLDDYLKRRPEFLGAGTRSRFLTTGNPERVSGKATQFLRHPIRFESA